MFCSSCGHENHESKFCVKCGTPLIEVETQSTPEVKPRTENEHVKKAKDAGQQFFRFSQSVLKQPAAAAERVGEEGFLNSLIAQVAIILLVPLITFISLSSISFFSPSFFDVVVKPWVYLLILFASINGATFLAVKLGKSDASFKAVVGRFGAFLIIPLILVIVSLVFAIIQLGGISSYALTFAFLVIFAAITLTVYSFKKQTSDQGQGLDALYAILLSFLIIGIVLRILAESMITSILQSFNPFSFL